MAAKCLFCLGLGPFSTVEHIIPESLGNDSDVLRGVVCDSCQNYFSHSVEKPALEQTPLAFWRVYLGIKTKKRKLPTVNLNPPTKGKLPSSHPLADLSIGLTAHEDGSTSLDVDNDAYVKALNTGNQTDYKMVLTPWHLSILGRFLSKVGLEYVAMNNLENAFEPQFDAVRQFARYGSTKFLWPIYWGQQGNLDDLKGQTVDKGDFMEQEIECYCYSLGETASGKYVFVLCMGIDVMMICLTHREPDTQLTSSIQNVSLHCICYPDGSW